MRHKLRPIKRLGQNFLTDPNIARKIVAAIPAPPNGRVVEIGAGTGALTRLLADSFSDFVALELDRRAVELLQREMPDVDIRQADALSVDWESLARFDGSQKLLHVVGNLPYYITSQILIGLVDARSAVASAVVMMQLEVAERIVSPHGSRTYGILSVVLQRYANVELLFRVSRNVFYPRPDVTSAVVRFTFDRQRAAADEHSDLFRDITRTAFNQRRKTLRNSLATILEDRTVTLPDEWAGKRAEQLSPDDFAALTRYIARGGA